MAFLKIKVNYLVNGYPVTISPKSVTEKFGGGVTEHLIAFRLYRDQGADNIQNQMFPMLFE